MRIAGLLSTRRDGILHGNRMNTEIINAHRRELRDGPYPLYRILDLIDDRDMDAETRASIRRDTARVVDVIVAHELRIPVEQLVDNAKAILRQPSPLAAKAFASWRSSLESATASRRALRRVARHFGPWISELTPSALNDALELFPRIAGLFGDLKEEEIVVIIRRVANTPCEASRRRMIAALTAYAETTGPILLACSRLAADAVRWNRAGELGRLVDRVPVTAMETSLDSERLLPAMAALCNACAAVDEATWAAAFDLCLALAAHDHGSARNAVRTMVRRRTRMEPDTLSDYLTDVRSLIDTVGIGALGFALRRLPRAYIAQGPERAGAFVRAAVDVARTDGITAAHRFLEGRTHAARSMLA